MRTFAWLAAALSCALVVVAIACSDSTAPRGNAQRLAEHFDSLWVEANALAGSSHGSEVRASALTALETPIAYGAGPSDITVLTDAGTEHWKGVILASAPADSSAQPFSLIAYRDVDAHTVLLASFQPDGSANATLIANDSVLVLATAGSGNVAKRAPDRDCTSATGLSNPAVALPDATRFTCKVGEFTAHLALIFPSTTTLDPALRSIFVAETMLNGVELARVSGEAHLR